jgi:hypothetical protein
MSDSVQIQCSTCGFHCTRTGGASFYERQTMESRPCPRCAACTLCVSGPKSQKLPRRLFIQEKRARVQVA